MNRSDIHRLDIHRSDIQRSDIQRSDIQRSDKQRLDIHRPESDGIMYIVPTPYAYIYHISPGLVAEMVAYWDKQWVWRQIHEPTAQHGMRSSVALLQSGTVLKRGGGTFSWSTIGEGKCNIGPHAEKILRCIVPKTIAPQMNIFCPLPV